MRVVGELEVGHHKIFFVKHGLSRCLLTLLTSLFLLEKCSWLAMGWFVYLGFAHRRLGGDRGLAS